jgi:[protein-PII] uridylyltransferase
MSRTFLNKDLLAAGSDLLHAKPQFPTGKVTEELDFSGPHFSKWLSDQTIQRFEDQFHWLEADPILLGSWSRDELCPQSDLDILFVAEESKVKKVVEQMQEAGIRLRYRVPQNKENLFEGVQAFDMLSLLKARPLTKNAAEVLESHQQKNSLRQTKKSILAVISKENLSRKKTV